MATSVLKNCKLYLAQYNLSADHNKIALSYGAEMKDDTVFGDDTKSNKAGLLTVGMSGEGFWQADADDYQVEDVIWSKFATADVPMTICPTTGADGERAFSFKSVLANYVPGESVGELLKFTIEANGTGKLARGTIMATGAKTTTGNGTARQLGAVTATQKVYAAMHVIAVSGTDPTLDMIVESDDAEGFASGVPRITFTQATAITSEWKTADGAITDDWWRASWTIGGTDDPSFTVVLFVGIL